MNIVATIVLPDGQETRVIREINNTVAISHESSAPNILHVRPEEGASVSVSQSGQNLVTVGTSKEENNTLVVQQSTGNKVTVSSAVFQNTGGASLWGNISGDITNQTDLIDYLDSPVQTIDIESENGNVFTIAVTNAGVLIVIPEGSTEPVITSPPVIIGTEKVWYTLGAIAGGATGSPVPERTWQWQRSTNGLTWTDITSAEAATYTLVSEDAGKYIRVQQTETNILDSVTTSSAATGLIAASVFSTTNYANITPITWEALTVQNWN